MTTIIRIVVRASDNPDIFAGFPNLQSLLGWMNSQFGSDQDEHHESAPPIDDTGDPQVVYEVDPDAEVLIGSPEFQKLNAALKEEVFKDEHFSSAFANFIRAGGRFVIDQSIERATYNGAFPPTITVKLRHLNPEPWEIGASFFIVAHELYHHAHPATEIVTAEVWAYLEAIAVLEAYRAVVRNRLQVAGLQGETNNIYMQAAGPSSDQEKMEALQRYFLPKYPSNQG